MNARATVLRGVAFATLLVACALLPATAGAARAVPGATHVVGTYDGSTLDLYVNGRLVSHQRSDMKVKGGQAGIEIGSFLGKEVWYGTIDEVALYDRAVPAGAIRHHYELGSGKLGGSYPGAVRQTPGLVAYWRLDDPSAEKAADSAGRHPGTYRPGTALRVPGLLANDPNHAAAFDGGAGDVVVPNAADLSLTDGFTVEAWADAGARRDQTVLAKVDSWFIKTNDLGQWGVGFLSGADIVSVYSKTVARVTPAPIALTNPPKTPAKSPTTPKKKKSSGTNTALISWVVIGVVLVGGWLIYRSRRRSRPDDGQDFDDDDGLEQPDGDGGADEEREPVAEYPARGRGDSGD
jgi:Concanavalin A-like lectin/glucanases superfamily